MSEYKRFWKIAVLLAAAAILIWGLPSVIGPKTVSVPQEFQDARILGAKISRDIVANYTQSAEALNKISELDKEEKYLEGLRAVLAQTEINSETRSKAQSLSVELEKMTRAASLINSQTVRAKALEAVSVEINLVTQLLAYNEYFNQLLEALRSKFTGEPRQATVSELISKMNQAADEINKLNEKFNSLMSEFDASF